VCGCRGNTYLLVICAKADGNGWVWADGVSASPGVMMDDGEGYASYERAMGRGRGYG
jgi:hypothetical protein